MEISSPKSGRKPGRPLRILQVFGSMNRGGAETWLMHVLRNIDRSRYQIDFLVHTAEPGAYDDEIRSLGSRIIACPDPSRPLSYARSFNRAQRANGPYDIVHSHVYLFDGMVLCLSARAGVPGRISHIYPLTDINRPSAARSAYRLAMTRLISRYATAVLTDSQSSLDAFKAICDCRKQLTSVVYCGIDLAPFNRQVDRNEVRQRLGLPVDKPLITYVARFVPHKNHRQAIRVAEIVNGQGYQYHFALAGSHGPLLEAMCGLAEEREDTSVLVGLPDISDLLLASDLFFFPSLEEGFGIVALEASAAGLPVVATRLPTIAEACAPSNRTFMFPSNDDQAAAASIRHILADPALRAGLSSDARRWAAGFSIDRSITELAAIYDRIGRRAAAGRTKMPQARQGNAGLTTGSGR